MWNHILSIYVLAICIFYFGATGSTQEKLSERIVGGIEASPHDAPYIAAILITTNSVQYIHVCGGSVISKRHVLSAAHCFFNHLSDKFSARMGSMYHNHSGTVIDVKTIINHPKYNPYTQDADIAVLELMKDVAFGRFPIHTVNLPSLEVKRGEILTVFGWGSTEASRNLNHLRKVNVPVVDWEDCRRRYAIRNIQITSNMFCAGILKTGGMDSCQRDSGGPIAKGNVVYGIVSFGFGCGYPDFPGVYTDVMKFVPWIQSNINI